MKKNDEAVVWEAYFFQKKKQAQSVPILPAIILGFNLGNRSREASTGAFRQWRYPDNMVIQLGII